MICMVRQRWGQPGEGRASRELCTFYTFVLCTALLILHPMMLLLEPICKKPLQKLICVSVNNSVEKQEGEKFCSNVQMFFPFLFILGFALFFNPSIWFSTYLSPLWGFVSVGFMGALILQQRSEGCRSILSIRYVALPSKLGVSKKKKDNNSCVLCSHFGCIDWKIKKKNNL